MYLFKLEEEEEGRKRWQVSAEAGSGNTITIILAI